MQSFDDLPVLGGALCLDFANTIDPRHDEPRKEFIRTYADLARWASFIGAVDDAQADGLARAGMAREREAEAVHGRAVELRDALYGVFSSNPLAPAEGPSLAILQGEWSAALEHATIERDGGGFRRGWQAEGQLDAMLWPIVSSAVDLLCSPARERVGECAGHGCGWLFVDTSKARRRRWCSMAICGNREKARRHRQRSAN